MTYTEKMILSGLAVWGYTRNYAKGFSRRGEDVSVVIAFLGGLAIILGAWACLGCAYLSGSVSDSGLTSAKSDTFIMTVVGVIIDGLSMYLGV